MLKGAQDARLDPLKCAQGSLPGTTTVRCILGNIGRDALMASEDDIRLKGKFAEQASFNPLIFEKIMTLVENGMTLMKACEAISEMDGVQVSTGLVRHWAKTSPERMERYIRAQEDKLEAWAEQIVIISDDRADDVMKDKQGNVLLDGRGNPVVDHENIQRSKLRVEARKWLLSKLRPDIYGERLAVTATQTHKVIPVTQEEIDDAQRKWLEQHAPDAMLPKSIN